MVDSYPAYFHPIIKHFVPRALFNMFNVPNVAKSVQDIFDSSALSSSLESAVRVGLVRYEASVEDLINVLRLAFRCAVRTVKDKSLKDLAEIDWLETLFT